MTKSLCPTMDEERESLDKYIKDRCVEAAIQDVVQSLLAAKPDNPREWLLKHLEQELSNESQDLSESELHRLFAATTKITSEIVPKDAIDSVIRETLHLLNCERVSLFVLDRKMNKLRLYASNLATPIMVAPGQGIVGKVFQDMRTVNIPDCYGDPRFDKSFDQQTGYRTESLIAVPILDFENDCVGVIQAINKLPTATAAMVRSPSGNNTRPVPFERSDEKILVNLTQHVGIAMRNADLYREAIATSERSTGLLNTIHDLSQDLGTQSTLLTLTLHANKIVNAERATVFLVDEVAQQLWSVSTDTGQEIRIPKTSGTAGLCCSTGQVINIQDAHADDRFNQDLDKVNGFKTQSILAVPMWEVDDAKAEVEKFVQHTHSHSPRPSLYEDREAEGPRVIGVIQMVNKVSFDGQLEIFGETDVRVLELFAKFVGPKLAASSMLSSRGRSESYTEAELALAPAPELPPGGTPRKRASSCIISLIPLGEEGNDAEQP